MDEFEHAVSELVDQLTGQYGQLGAPERLIAFASVREDRLRALTASTFARQAAARSGGGACLFDLDLVGERHYRAIAEGPDAARFGPLVPEDRMNGAPPFWRAEAPGGIAPERNASMLRLYRLAAAPLIVSRFHGEALPETARVTLIDQPAYWRAARKLADAVVVDAPDATRSKAAALIARRADLVVIVARREDRRLAEAGKLREHLEKNGAKRIVAIVVETAGRREKA
ncbi:MAG: hypothetical protein PVI23_04470 [Maricaulaceae bacterium]|jgi:hypothetical protein